MDLYADDAVVCSFGLTAMLNMNFTMSEQLAFFPNFKDVETFDADLKKCNVPMNPGKHYTEIFNSYATKAVEAFNAKYAKGIPIGALVPELAMIAGVLKNATMTPYLADGWMYAGFSMQADLPHAAEDYELKFLSN